MKCSDKYAINKKRLGPYEGTKKSSIYKVFICSHIFGDASLSGLNIKYE